MFLNETICVLESEYSGQEVQDVGTGIGIGIALTLVVVAVVGFVIKGFFIYYIKYEAPKERPINTMISIEQVSPLLYGHSFNCTNNLLCNLRRLAFLS